MTVARHLLGLGLFAAATQVQAAGWLDDDITDILNKVKSIFTTVTGDVKSAAQHLVEQAQRRSQAMRDNADDLVTWFGNRQTPLQDFVNGGSGRCSTGSPCAGFRSDLRTFALQMAELKDRFPVLNQHGLGDTTFFAELVGIVPPIVLFGLHEILKRIPDWQDLPVDLADIFDEIGDSEAFSTTVEPSPQVVAAALHDSMKFALATNRSATGLGKAFTPTEKFCLTNTEARIDDVRFNKLKGLVYRWKNRFDSFSEYPKEDAEIILAGEGLGGFKIPTKPFLKTVSNALDSLHDMMETHRDNLAQCTKVEEDLAACAPLAEYRTQAGSKKAYFVFAGILNRKSLAELDKTNANNYASQARTKYNAGKYKESYMSLCSAYAAL
jgi:hypothetical protein